MSAKKQVETRDAYTQFVRITTRWSDNDMYGHVNNVVYYSYFDTAVNQYLIATGALDPIESPFIGLVVESQCQYHAPVAFPEVLTLGVRAAHVGNTSVRYELAVFKDDENTASAQGHFVHVYVDRNTGRPASLTQAMLDALKSIRVAFDVNGQHGL